MSVSTRDDAGPQCTIVRVSGEADVSTLAFEEAIRAEVAKRPGMLLIDTSGLLFLDSYALHVLIRAYQELHRAGIVMALVSPSASVARLLELTGADQVIPVFAGADEAIASATADRGPP